MSFLNALIEREPVMTMAVIQSALGLAMAFGFNLTAQQMGAILLFSASVLGWLVRKKVSVDLTPINDKIAADKQAKQG